MAEFSTVMRELYRMCGSFATCEGGCPLNEWHGNACYEDCYQAVKNQPEEAEKIIVRWTTEHPAETRLQKFKELFPNAPLSSRYMIPNVCVKSLGWNAADTDCANSSCCDCWDRPYEDNEVE